jgi:ABC-type sugar transport system substrate-binding protein
LHAWPIFQIKANQRGKGNCSMSNFRGKIKTAAIGLALLSGPIWISAMALQSAFAADNIIDQYLIPSTDATNIDREPGPVTTDPLSNAPVQLPFWNTFPLPDGPVGDPNKTYLICFSQAMENNPWPLAMKATMMLEEKRHPNVKVLYYNTNGDPLQQIQDLQTCAARNPAAIIIWPHSIKPLTPAVEDLSKRGFVVVGVERKVATKSYRSWIFDNDVGEMHVLANAAAEYLKGKGTIAVVTGELGSSPQIIRTYGFKTALEGHPGIDLVTMPPTDYSPAKSYEVTMQYLLSPEGKKVNAIFAEAGSIGMGVVQALKQSKRTDIPVFTLDGSKAEIKAVEHGEIQALIPHSPLFGDVALRVALYHALGKEAPKNIVLQPMQLIEKDNAGSMGQYGYGPAPK